MLVNHWSMSVNESKSVNPSPVGPPPSKRRKLSEVLSRVAVLDLPEDPSRNGARLGVRPGTKLKRPGTGVMQ